MKSHFIVVASLALVACATVPQVTKGVASANTFSNHQSYTWRAKPSMHSLLSRERVVTDIDNQMHSNGWNESGNGDIAIVADVVTSQKERSSSFRSQGTTRGWGLRAGQDPRGNGTVEMNGPAVKTTHMEKVSTVTIKMFDAKSQAEIWHGAVRIAVSNSQERNDEAVDAAITRLFKGFPQPGQH